MLNFNYDIPTKIFFGEGQIKVLSEQIKKYGSRVLLVYGGGSIKKNGIYDTITDILKANDIPFWELGGVDPNPRISSVREGINLCRFNNIDFILPVGGGSAIDCAKAIAAGYYHNSDPWELVLDNSEITQALPIGTVLTLAATGSEMNMNAVISNMETNQKLAIMHPVVIPKFSILDPTYTYTVPSYHTAAGVADIMSHVFETYFGHVKDAFLQDRIAEAILSTCLRYGPVAVNEPENYEARANIMWASTLALNNLLKYGKETGWCVHPMEHELSAYYDISHGAGLAVLTPNWMEYVLDDQTVDHFAIYGINVWDLDSGKDKYKIALQAIGKTRDFFNSLGLPSTLSDMGINEEKLDIMAKAAVQRGTISTFRPLDSSDVLNIFKKSL